MLKIVQIYPKMWAVKLIKIYQKTLSFDHGFFKFLYPHGFCRFKPTCSEYAIGAVERFGFWRGGFKAFWRVLRCNPWNKGGWDPPV
ncbi:MAG: membrane protein insertion efficiency factor YidD [Patescibacteria group bacterium]